MLIQIASGILLIYLVYCSLLFLVQRYVVFPSYQISVPESADVRIPGFERIWVETSFGKVETWFLPPQRRSGPAPAVIFAHGNAELIDFWPDGLETFLRLGIGILLVEYPGYGRSDGQPSEESIRETFVAAYDKLVRREDIDASRILLFGRSLGGGAACALAAERPSAALVLLSTFTGIRDMASRFLIPGFIVRDPFDNLSVVASYPGYVLVVHGKHDSLIPYDHALALHKASKRGRILTYNCGHNDCPPDWNSFWREMESFLGDAGIIQKLE